MSRALRPGRPAKTGKATEREVKAEAGFKDPGRKRNKKEGKEEEEEIGMRRMIKRPLSSLSHSQWFFLSPSLSLNCDVTFQNGQVFSWKRRGGLDSPLQWVGVIDKAVIGLRNGLDSAKIEFSVLNAERFKSQDGKLLVTCTIHLLEVSSLLSVSLC